MKIPDQDPRKKKIEKKPILNHSLFSLPVKVTAPPKRYSVSNACYHRTAGFLVFTVLMLKAEQAPPNNKFILGEAVDTQGA